MLLRALVPGVAPRAAALALAALLPAALLTPAGATPAAPTAPSAPSAPARAAAPPSTVAPATGVAPGSGRWRVRPVGTSAYEVSWRAPRPLPVTSDRPTIVPRAGVAADVRVGTPRVSGGRTVVALVRAEAPPRPADLDVVLSGERLDEPGDDRRAVSTARPDRVAAPAEEDVAALGGDPGEPGDLTTVSSDYELDPVVLPGMPEPIEMVGHVVEPAPGQLQEDVPLVLLQHGRHATCYDPARPDRYVYGAWPCRGRFAEIPSHLGYEYAQQLLASQGYATVSIRVNGINAQDDRLDDAGADARATIIQRHLDHWVDLAPAHRVDLQRVVLVGHSRGGEGVDRASIQIPLSAPYRVAGQVLIAPTDFGSQTAPYVPTVTLLPYCDGDVSDLQGQRFTDVARDLARDDTSLKSSVLVLGANHNYFNSEWTPGVAVAPASDDWYGRDHRPCGAEHPDRLSDSEQRDVGATYVAGAVALFTGADDLLPMFDGSVVDLPSIGGARVLSHAIGGGRDLRRPSLDTDLSLALGARTAFCTGATSWRTDRGACGERVLRQVTPHWTGSYDDAPSRRFFEMSWDAVGQRGGMLLRTPLDLTGRRLELRTLVDPRVGDVELGVRLEDATGAATEVSPQGGGLLPALPAGRAKIWAQSLLVDPADPDDPAGIDLSRVVRVDLVSRNERGRVWVADLSAAPTSVVAVPGTRLGTLDLGAVRIPEGDGPGQVTARVPYAVNGLDRPGRALFVVIGSDERRRDRFVVDLAPGQTSGSLAVTYDADDLDDYRVLAQTRIAAYPLRGLTTDSYVGSGLVVDDDATPAIRLRPARRTVQEGSAVRFRVELAAPVDYPLRGFSRLVRGAGAPLSVGDVPRAFLRRIGVRDDATTPLDRTGAVLPFDGIPPGRTRATMALPTLDDDRREARESVGLLLRLFTAGGRRKVETVASVARSD